MALAVEFNSELVERTSRSGYNMYTYLEDYLDEALGIHIINPRVQDIKYSSWLNKTYGNERSFLPSTTPHNEVIEAAKLFLETTPTPTPTP